MNKLSNDYLIKKTFNSYLLMSVIGVLSGTLGMLVDGLVVGNFMDKEGLSAYGLAMPVMIIMTALAATLTNGGLARYGEHIGRGQREKIRMSFTINLLLNLIVGAVLTVIGCIFSTQIAGLLGAKGVILKPTADYVRALMLGAIPILLSQAVGGYVRMDGTPQLVLLGAVAMTAVNVGLDLLFVIVLKKGMFEVGLATSVSYLATVLLLASHFLSKKNTLRFGSLKGAGAESIHILVSGFPSALNKLCTTIRTLITNNIAVAVGGALTMAAMSIQSNINQVLSSITIGIGMTTLLISAVFFGERDKDALERTLKVSLRNGLIMTGIITIIVLAFSPWIVDKFCGDAAVVEKAAFSLRIFSLSLPAALVNVVFLNYYQTGKNLFMANYICVAHGVAFISLFAAALTGAFGENGLWVSFAAGETVSALLLPAMVRIRSGRWPKKLADFLLLPADFDENAAAVLSLSIKADMNEVVTLSEKIGEFCGRYNQDKRRIYKASLCIEEMAGNVVKHAFAQSNKADRYIDLCVKITDSGSFILRLRDNGRRFDPVAYAQQRGDKELAADNIGIRMVCAVAEKIAYENAVGLNNTVITL